MDSKKNGLASCVFITRICINVFRVAFGSISAYSIGFCAAHNVSCGLSEYASAGRLLRSFVFIPPERPLSRIQKYTHGIDKKNPYYNLKLPRQSMMNKQRAMCQQ